MIDDALRTIVAVVPHPDDESYAFAGTLATAVAGGARAYVIAATAGERGQDLSGEGLVGEALAEVRREELAHSCRALGAEPPNFLGLPDGDVGAHLDEGCAALSALLEALAPDVVLTLGEDGAYGHVDHLACTQMVGRAFGAGACGPRARLFHALFPRGLFEGFWRQMRAQFPELVAIDDPARLGTDPTGADIVVDIRAHREEKLASIAAHRTQVEAGDPHRFLAPGVVDALLDVERYRLVKNNAPTA